MPTYLSNAPGAAEWFAAATALRRLRAEVANAEKLLNRVNETGVQLVDAAAMEASEDALVDASGEAAAALDAFARWMRETGAAGR